MAASWSGYSPFPPAAGGPELPLEEGELPAARPRAAPRRLAALGLAAAAALLAGAAWAGVRAWGPRSGRVHSLEVKEANEAVLVDAPEVTVQGVHTRMPASSVSGVSVQSIDAEASDHLVQQESLSNLGQSTRGSAEANPEEGLSKPGQSTEGSTAAGGDANKVADQNEEESEYSSSEWEVVYKGSANVRKERDLKSDILAIKHSGSIVVGRRWGEWLALLNEPGYMAIALEDDEILRRRAVSYSRLVHGACADISKHPIVDADTCQNAGFALGYFDSTIGIYEGDLERPEGCYEYKGQLWVATNPLHQGKGAIGDRKPLCSSNAYPTTTTVTVTRTSTTRTITSTSTTTTTWGYPSLFCIEVVRTHGYELPLVKAQQRVHASIFSCDEYRVFSDGGKTELIGIAPDGTEIKTIVIPPIKKKKMALNIQAGVTTDSWLNTATFLQVWDLAHKKDGRLLRHDWVVKVDPDAVFFPERLRDRLRPHTHLGVNVFVMNCDRYTPVALYGSLEIFSKKAIQTYLERQWDCRNNLPWHGWGEDFYMSHCMDHLKVNRLNDFTLIGDKRCHYAACDVTSKAVYHDYKNQTDWFKCWDLSRQTEARQAKR